MTTEYEVVANVSPRSLGAHSLFAAPEPITARNVTAYHSAPDDIRDAKKALRKMGFVVFDEASSETFLSIGGSAKLFREVFGAKLKKQKFTMMPGQEVEAMAMGDDPAEQVLGAPGELADLIEGVTIPRPPEYFAAAPIPPLAAIQPNAYRYLFVPDEVAVISRAARVHRLGVTGKNIVVGMADTGHAAHPFFNWRGYRLLTTLLGPGAADPATDPNGHGTGESANVFANAPDCRLRPLKLGNDTAGAITTLVNSSPKPQILTNSWGYHVDFPNTSLPAWLVPLEAAVADAVAQGITVLFSAGNGHRAFPASHPDVIAVGGVHVSWPDLTLEASSYASSFVSSFYPNRRVPDVCGLTGRRVNQGGNGFAPSLMLPVPEGSQLDGIWPPTGAANDGWGIFSGTSAACPQVAGICALLLEKDPTLTPATIKQKLMQGARDVTAGTTATGDTAGPGNDLATGAGLADAKWSYIVTMGEITASFLAASKEEQVAMLSQGRMPQVSREFIDDMIDTLRSR
jgi:subtilisin family serine protease